MITLLARLTYKAVRHEVQRASAQREDAAQEGSEEERMLGTLDPELADALRARAAAHAVGPSQASPATHSMALSAPLAVSWDTSRSIAPPS
jgi:hypothetical protein